jgi:putative transposase
MSPSKIVQYIKGRSSRLIQDEFPNIKKRYWGQHMWARGYFCSTVGAVTEETIKTYIENQEVEGNKENFKINDEFQSDT